MSKRYDTLIADFSDPLFQDAFQRYFSEIGISVTDWDGLFREMDSEDGNAAFVRTSEDGRMIGFILFTSIQFTSWFFEENCGFIREFWISGPFRNGGHGSELLAMTEKHFYEQGLFTSILTTDTAARFYQRRGYVKAPGCRAKNHDDVFVKRLK